MLFKSKVPMSHRVAFFFAVVLTVNPLVKWMNGSDFNPSAILPLICFWGIVVFHFVLRRNPSWQLGNAVGQYNLIDLVGSRFEQLPVSARIGYWVVLILAAVIIWLLSQ